MGQTFRPRRQRVPIVGTNANNGLQARAFTLNVNNASSNSNVNIRSRTTFRLNFVDCVKVCPHPLVKERAIPIGVSRLRLESSGMRLEIA